MKIHPYIIDNQDNKSLIELLSIGAIQGIDQQRKKDIDSGVFGKVVRSALFPFAGPIESIFTDDSAPSQPQLASKVYIEKWHQGDINSPSFVFIHGFLAEGN